MEGGALAWGYYGRMLHVGGSALLQEDGGIFFPMLYFLLIPEFMQGLLLLCSLEEGECAIRCISLASFSYALFIGLAVLFLLSEGELFEGLFDGLFDRSGSGGKMNRSR